MNRTASLYHRDDEGRWSLLPDAPDVVRRVVPWGVGGAMVASETTVYEWTGSSYIDRTPALADDEQILDIAVHQEQLFVLGYRGWREPGSLVHRGNDGTWTKTELPEGIGRLVVGSSGLFVFPSRDLARRWSNGTWKTVDVPFQRIAGRHLIDGQGRIWSIVRFQRSGSGKGWGITRFDPATREWVVEPVPDGDWRWIGASGSEVWAVEPRGAARFDGREWTTREFEPAGAFAAGWSNADGVLVHEYERIVRIESCDEA